MCGYGRGVRALAPDGIYRAHAAGLPGRDEAGYDADDDGDGEADEDIAGSEVEDEGGLVGTEEIVGQRCQAIDEHEAHEAAYDAEQYGLEQEL